MYIVKSLYKGWRDGHVIWIPMKSLHTTLESAADVADLKIHCKALSDRYKDVRIYKDDKELDLKECLAPCEEMMRKYTEANSNNNQKRSNAAPRETSFPASTSDTAALFSIISVSFSSSGKTYDYLLENRSKQKVFKDQKVKIVTGGNSSQTVHFKHLKKTESIPSRVTKKLILMSPETAIVGIVGK